MLISPCLYIGNTPQQIIREYQELASECGSHQIVEEVAPERVTQGLETMLTIIEEGMHLLSESSYVTEYSLLCRMHRGITQHLRLLSVYGVNDQTIPSVALYPCLQVYIGLRGRPKVFINIESVELLRSYGYTME